MNQCYARRGFTLLEMLVVVLIIGILAAVALPQYQKAVARNQLATLKQLTQSIVSAEEIYYLAQGEYSANFSELILTMPENKESDSTTNWYHYSWGRCFTGKGDYARACCYHDKAHLGYCAYFAHHPSLPHRRLCMVLDATDTTHWRNSICKVETKANYGTVNSGDKLVQWVYQNN